MDIKKISKTNFFILASSSLDIIEIQYNQYDSVVISPKNKIVL